MNEEKEASDFGFNGHAILQNNFLPHCSPVPIPQVEHLGSHTVLAVIRHNM